MKEVIKELQGLRNAPVDRNGNYFANDCGCNPRKVMSTIIGVYMFCSTYDTIIHVTENHVKIFRETGRTKLPYKCEDKNEYFQLNMIHDYFGMTYEDFNELKDLARYMKCRIILDAKTN